MASLSEARLKLWTLDLMVTGRPRHNGKEELEMEPYE
jgi:hypothetical protein